MAFNKNNAQTTTNYADLPKLSLTGATVSGCRYLSDKVIAFTLNFPGLSIYNMKAIDGQKGAFISVPQQKNPKKADQWVDVVSVWLTEDDEKRLVDAVSEHAAMKGYTVDWKTRYEVK